MKPVLHFFLMAGILTLVVPVISCGSLKRERTGVSADSNLMIRLNGLEQFVEIHGKSDKNPVLLFIHGGPSWPATPMIRSRNQDLFRDITVVSWDQRNCGKSATDTSVAINLDLYINDAHELTQFLKSRFNTQKIFIACHSWGSIIGLNLINRYPEDYAAYIGLGQVVNIRKSDSISRDHVCRLAGEAGDSATLRAEKEIPFTVENGYPGGLDDMVKHRMLIAKYRINDHDTVYENQAIMQYEDYKNLDWLTPVFREGRRLFPEMMATDFTAMTNFQIPVYLMAGRYDYNTANPLVSEYFKTITAPKKEFFWYENSGHSPQWEEPDLFADRIREICLR